MKYKVLLEMLEADLEQNLRQLIVEEIIKIFQNKKLLKEMASIAMSNMNDIRKPLPPKTTLKSQLPPAEHQKLLSKYKSIVERQNGNAPLTIDAINESVDNALVNIDNITLAGHETIAHSEDTIKKAIEIQTKDYRRLLKKCR